MINTKDAGCSICGKDTHGALDCPERKSRPFKHEFNQSGSKYLRPILGAVNNKIDVYAVLLTFGVMCPARQHAIKKLLCSGLRGKGNAIQDLKEARDAIDRAIQMEESKIKEDEPRDSSQTQFPNL